MGSIPAAGSEKMAKKSRLELLSKKEERVTVRKIAWLSIFSLILAIFLFMWGVPLLGKFADLLDVVFRKTEQPTITKSTLSPPRLDELPVATNSARLPISGVTQGGVKIEIFVNDEKLTETNIVDNRFIGEITLVNGQNLLSVRSLDANDNKSDFSQVARIILDIEEPKLEINTPSDGQSFSGDNRIKVSGKTDSDSQVFVNNFLASVNFVGDFEILVPVSDGENVIEIKAIDSSGNAKSETRKVTFKK